MNFKATNVPAFVQLFEERMQTIRAFDGCRHLELWQDNTNPNIFFTYSIWESQAHLDHYRFSGFFKDTWGRTKVLFDGRPQAWSVTQRYVA